VLIIGILKSIAQAFDFSELDLVVDKFGIPSVAKKTDEKLLLGYILQNVDSCPDNDCWEYSKTTQNTVELIGGCEHGLEEFKYFTNGFKKSDLPDVVFSGRSWKDIPYESLSPRFKKIFDDPKKYHSPKFFRRFAFGEINGTITASAQPENCGITHPVENRRYKVREIARIQSFPDNYLFGSIPLQSRYKVIGNAVPPVLGWVVAYALINHLSNA
jgi:DNA (cytosine-5)-methyltransferase 1